MPFCLICFFSTFAQAEQHRQRHPVWKPGGGPHLPAGTVCGIGGVYQVRHVRHKWHVKTPPLWSRAALGPIGSILWAAAEGRHDIFSSIYGIAHMLTVQTFCREIWLNIFIPSGFLPQSSTCLWIFYCIEKTANHLFLGWLIFYAVVFQLNAA